MKKFLRFLISKQFLLNVLAIIIVWVLIIQIDKWWLKYTTDFGEEIEVPSFYKVHMGDLDQFVADKDLDYEIVDSVYMDDWPKGTVCWQYPKPTDSSGMKIKGGRVIQLSIVPETPQMVFMNNVEDMSKRMGENTLNAIGIRTKVTYKPSPDNGGYIMEHKFNGKRVDTSGMYIPKGSRVELIVAKGKTGEATPLPNVVGLTINQAKERFSSLALSIAPQCEDCITPEDLQNAVITRQSPVGGQNVNVAAGTTVTLWASVNAQAQE